MAGSLVAVSAAAGGTPTPGGEAERAFPFWRRSPFVMGAALVFLRLIMVSAPPLQVVRARPSRRGQIHAGVARGLDYCSRTRGEQRLDGARLGGTTPQVGGDAPGLTLWIFFPCAAHVHAPHHATSGSCFLTRVPEAASGHDGTTQDCVAGKLKVEKCCHQCSQKAAGALLARNTRFARHDFVAIQYLVGVVSYLLPSGLTPSS